MEALAESRRFSGAGIFNVWLKWWTPGPFDLDLHVILQRGDTIEDVCYRARNASTGSVRLSEDCRSGPGEEHASIELREDEVYHFVVHAYGASPGFRFDSLQVMLDFEQPRPFISEMIGPPSTGGPWWHVVTINGSTGVWAKVSTTSIEPPF